MTQQISTQGEETPKKQKLPTLQQLNLSPEKAFKNDQFKLLLNKPPKDAWLKINKFASNSKYLPIDKVEYLLDLIFQEWRVEVLNVQSIFNSVAVTIRLHYLNPTNGEWSYHDGCGAKDMQVDSGSAASNMSAIKGNAVMLGLPIAKSYAIKDAAHHIGKLFGRDVNRKDVEEYKSVYVEPNHEQERLKKLINTCNTLQELEAFSELCAEFDLLDFYNNKKETLKP